MTIGNKPRRWIAGIVVGTVVASAGMLARFVLDARQVAAAAVIGAAAAVQTAVVDDQAAAVFLRELQRDVARDDRAAVSTRIRYPITVFAGGVRIPIPDAAALLQNYDVVFSPALKSAIARAAIPSRGRPAPPVSVAVAADAITIGIDTVRIEPVGSELKITRITVPLATAAAAGPEASSRRTGRDPQRLVLDVGQLQRAGALASGERDVYVLSAAKNKLLDVRITGVSGRDIVARIVSAKTRASIDTRARDGVRTWTGRVPEDGDYRIEVVRLAARGAPRLAYVMVVSMR